MKDGLMRITHEMSDTNMQKTIITEADIMVAMVTAVQQLLVL